MGFLKKAGRALGQVDKDLIANGLLARGRVTECRRTAMSTGNQVRNVVCELTVEVELESRPVYTAECKHPIPMPYLPQFESGQGFVAVRVDPGDPQNVALDLSHDVPSSRDGAAATGGDTVQVTMQAAGCPRTWLPNLRPRVSTSVPARVPHRTARGRCRRPRSSPPGHRAEPSSSRPSRSVSRRTGSTCGVWSSSFPVRTFRPSAGATSTME